MCVCCEQESIQYLFFDCIVAKEIWSIVSDACDTAAPSSFTDLTIQWNRKKQKVVMLFPRLTCGAYGFYEMNLFFRGGDGEICAALWI